jgi:hypothetical protein
LVDRLAVNWGYDLSWVSEQFFVDARATDPTTRSVSNSWVKVRHNTASHGLVLGALARIRPWWAVGPELSAHEHFTAPSEPWLDRVGVRFGKRRTIGTGAVFDFRPLQRTWSARSRLLLRIGLRVLWTDFQLSVDSHVTKPEQRVYPLGMVWGAVGYSFPLGEQVCLDLQAHAGMTEDLRVLGVRLGGGFR